MTTAPKAITEQILRMEEALASDEVRASKYALSTILHPKFQEIGKSGRMFTYASIINDLTENAATSSYDIIDFNVAIIKNGVALATYRIPARTVCDQDHPASFRSSLWIMEDGVWLLRFHQGTVIPENTLT